MYLLRIRFDPRACSLEAVVGSGFVVADGHAHPSVFSRDEGVANESVRLPHRGLHVVLPLGEKIKKLPGPGA